MAIGQEAKDMGWKEGSSGLVLWKLGLSSWSPEWIVQRCCGISIAGDGQNPVEHGIEKSALADPPMPMELGLWEVPARLSCSVVLPPVLILRLRHCTGLFFF